MKSLFFGLLMLTFVFPNAYCEQTSNDKTDVKVNEDTDTDPDNDRLGILGMEIGVDMSTSAEDLVRFGAY